MPVISDRNKNTHLVVCCVVVAIFTCNMGIINQVSKKVYLV